MSYQRKTKRGVSLQTFIIYLERSCEKAFKLVQKPDPAELRKFLAEHPDVKVDLY
jgi:hypothetical protein